MVAKMKKWGGRNDSLPHPLNETLTHIPGPGGGGGAGAIGAMGGGGGAACMDIGGGPGGIGAAGYK